MYYGRRTGSSLMRSEAIRYAVILGFFGFIMPASTTSRMPGVLWRISRRAFLDPLKPERIDHIVIALLCLPHVRRRVVVVTVAQSAGSWPVFRLEP